MACWAAMRASTEASAPVAATTSRAAVGPRLVEVRVAEARAEQRALGVVGQAEGPEHEQRALALAEVVEGALAGLGRIAEEAEDVVAHLEGHADGVAVGAQGGARPRAPSAAGARAAPRSSGRVTVYRADLSSATWRAPSSSGLVVGGQHEVEVLPGDHLAAERR